MIQLSDEAHAELVSRLTALQGLAEQLEGAFDDPETRAGAQKVADSVERMLAILGASGGRD